MLGVLSMWLLLCVPMFFFPGCVCCGATCDLTNCNIHDNWRVVVSGVTNDAFANCDDYNGTFDFDLTAGSSQICCHPIDIDATNLTRIMLSFFSPGGLYSGKLNSVEIRFGKNYSAYNGTCTLDATQIAYYDIIYGTPASAPACSNTGPFTLSQGITSTDCATWPATLTVTAL